MVQNDPIWYKIPTDFSATTFTTFAYKEANFWNYHNERLFILFILLKHNAEIF